MKKDSPTTLKAPLKAPEPLPFTGIARSVEAFDNQGFRNFRIITLYLENGRVLKLTYSDPYASFEAMAKMELWNMDSIIHLNNNWLPGRTLEK